VAAQNLAILLTDLAKAGDETKEISVRELRDVVGRRSFAPALLATSVIGFTPIGTVPGVATILATVIVLVAVQLILGKKSLWLPDYLLERRIGGKRLSKGANAMLPIARAVDRAVRPRLVFLTERPLSYLIALAAITIALTVPPLEFVPLVDIPLWAALLAFSLALAAHDGLLAIVAFVLTAAGLVLVAMAIL
jgi:hypothetical protein